MKIIDAQVHIWSQTVTPTIRARDDVNGDVACVGVLLEAIQDAQAVHRWQPDVEQDDGMVAAVPGGLSLFTVACPLDEDSLLMKRTREALADHRIVFDKKYAHEWSVFSGSLAVDERG